MFGMLSTTNKSLVCSLCGRAQKQEAWVLSSRSKAEELAARTAQEAPSQARREASANRRLEAGVYAALIFWPAGLPSSGTAARQKGGGGKPKAACFSQQPFRYYHQCYTDRPSNPGSIARTPPDWGWLRICALRRVAPAGLLLFCRRAAA